MNDIYLNLSSGTGPKECRWVAGKVLQIFMKEAKVVGVSVENFSEAGGKAGTYLLKVSGRGADSFARARTGTIKWIGQSPFRKTHKRKNWFVGVSVIPAINEVQDFRAADIKFQSMKASGPGGQHVNATESAVRATHIPTGISVTAREERSQHANKKLCLIKLSAIFQERADASKSTAKEGLWKKHKTLERGNEVRTYKGAKFQLV